jgi:hypothetical protein
LLLIEILSVLGLISGVDLPRLLQDPGVDVGVTIVETPAPATYVVSTQLECAGTSFIVEIESGQANRSRIIRATADGRAILLRVGDENLGALIETVRVVGLQPIGCGLQQPFLQIAVRVYDPSLDAQPGQDGETVLFATASHR